MHSNTRRSNLWVMWGGKMTVITPFFHVRSISSVHSCHGCQKVADLHIPLRSSPREYNVSWPEWRLQTSSTMMQESQLEHPDTRNCFQGHLQYTRCNCCDFLCNNTLSNLLWSILWEGSVVFELWTLITLVPQANWACDFKICSALSKK
jgi:hypothetical protein